MSTDKIAQYVKMQLHCISKSVCFRFGFSKYFVFCFLFLFALKDSVPLFRPYELSELIRLTKVKQKMKMDVCIRSHKSIKLFIWSAKRHKAQSTRHKVVDMISIMPYANQRKNGDSVINSTSMICVNEQFRLHFYFIFFIRLPNTAVIAADAASLSYIFSFSARLNDLSYSIK